MTASRREPPKSPEDLLTANLDRVRRATESVGRRSGLSPTEIEDLFSELCLKLIEDDYAVLRRWRGDCSFSTYLRAVTLNLAIDGIRRTCGRWRPSAVARRLGNDAIALERLLRLDGRTLDEAIRTLRDNYECEKSVEELEEVAIQLPADNRPRAFVSTEALHEMGARDAVDRRAVDRDNQLRQHRVREVLDGAWRGVDPEHRLLFELVVPRGLTVAAAAKALGLDQKRSYRILEKIKAGLKRRFQSAKLEWSEVSCLIGWANLDLGLEDES